jgi:hypothetical protein
VPNLTMAYKALNDRKRVNGSSRPVSSNVSAVAPSLPPSRGVSPMPMSRKALAPSVCDSSLDVDAFSSISEVTAVCHTKFDFDAVIDLFIEISSLFDPILLPRYVFSRCVCIANVILQLLSYCRFRMRWLEYLARMHDLRSNRAEGGEIRWRLFKLCEGVESTWDQVWAPREPLVWTADAGFDATKGRNFLLTFHTTVTTPGRWWLNSMQLKEHMIVSLAESANKFATISLFHLAERGYHSLLQLHRQDGQLSDMNAVYQKIATMFTSHLSSSFAMGLFYRVYYFGQGALTSFCLTD